MIIQKTAAVLACAGSGSRMEKSCTDKLLYDCNGMPVAAYSIKAYDEAESIDLIVIVTQPDLVPVYSQFKEKYGIRKEVIVTTGGATRTESVLKGVLCVPEKYTFVAIGDGARPLTRPADIDDTVVRAWVTGAAALGVPLTDTIKEVSGFTILKTVPRERLVGIQTPQVFRREDYLELVHRALQSREQFTDDASIFEYYDREVSFVQGHRDNIKITVPEDLDTFRALLEVRK